MEENYLMRKRTSRLLSLVLAAAMTISCNTSAFAYGCGCPEISYDSDGDVIITNATNPVSWNQMNNEREISAVLFGNVTDHLVNETKVTVSGDKRVRSISCNVMPVQGAENYYLVFGYGSDSMIEVKDEGYIPATSYDGRKICFKKTGKDTASKSEDVNAHIGLIKYDEAEKKVTELGGVTVTDLKMKNNVDANVSENGIGPCICLGYSKIEGRELATFTVNAKVKFAKGENVDKSVKTGIAKTLKATPFKLAIMPMTISFGQKSGYDITDSKWDISANRVDNLSDIIRSNIVVKKMNTKGSGKATLTYPVFVGNYRTDDGKDVYKTINPKDYTLKTATVGGETVVVLDSVNNPNYKYIPYVNKYKLCFRQKDKKTISYGIYESDKNAYVDSITE